MSRPICPDCGVNEVALGYGGKNYKKRCDGCQQEFDRDINRRVMDRKNAKRSENRAARRAKDEND